MMKKNFKILDQNHKERLLQNNKLMKWWRD